MKVPKNKRDLGLDKHYHGQMISLTKLPIYSLPSPPCMTTYQRAINTNKTQFPASRAPLKANSLNTNDHHTQWPFVYMIGQQWYDIAFCFRQYRQYCDIIEVFKRPVLVRTGFILNRRLSMHSRSIVQSVRILQIKQSTLSQIPFYRIYLIKKKN